jgi:hypothetical protein
MARSTSSLRAEARSEPVSRGRLAYRATGAGFVGSQQLLGRYCGMRAETRGLAEDLDRVVFVLVAGPRSNPATVRVSRSCRATSAAGTPAKPRKSRHPLADRRHQVADALSKLAEDELNRVKGERDQADVKSTGTRRARTAQSEDQEPE